MLLFACAVVYAIGVARLRIWRMAQGSRRMTVGMFAIAIASTLFLRPFGQRAIGPPKLLGANPIDLGQHLFALVGCYQLSAAAIECAWGYKPVRYWRLAAMLLAACLALTYRLGDAWSTPAREFQLSDIMSLMHDWIVLTSALAAFIILLVASLETMVIGPRRLSMYLMYCLAAIAIGCNGTLAVMLAAQPGWVHARYNEWATHWITVALGVLAVAGIPALWDAWIDRHEPRR